MSDLKAFTLDEGAILYLDSIIKEKLEEKYQRIVYDLIDAVSQIWSFDTTVRFYTTHRLDHNLRVIFYLYTLIDKSKLKINSTAYFLLTSACLLHDIGLQCQNAQILSKYITNTNQDSQEKENVIRKRHPNITVDWIKYLYEHQELFLSNVLRRIPTIHLDPIIEIIENHSSPDLFLNHKKRTYVHLSQEKDLRILILLMRLADELDIGRDRGDIENPIANKLPLENSIFFWMHYYTLVLLEEPATITLRIELHPKDTDKEQVLKEQIYLKFIEKNKKLINELIEFYKIPLIFSYDFKPNAFLKIMDHNVFELIASKSIEFLPKAPIIEYKYRVNDILEVFNLDKQLLPDLYSDTVQHAFGETQALNMFTFNPYMTVGAYKNNKLIGYLTLIPIKEDTLDKILKFELLESDVNLHDVFNYANNDLHISWYIAGLGVINRERGARNYPAILAGLIDQVSHLVKDILIPKNIKVHRIGTVAYTITATKLCNMKFDMVFVKEAKFLVDNFKPKSFVCTVDSSTSKYINQLFI